MLSLAAHDILSKYKIVPKKNIDNNNLCQSEDTNNNKRKKPW